MANEIVMVVVVVLVAYDTALPGLLRTHYC